MTVTLANLYPQWKHYTECDGSPDPWVAQEMNTFISLWEEEKNQAFEQVMEKSKLVLSVSTALPDSTPSVGSLTRRAVLSPACLCFPTLQSRAFPTQWETCIPS